MVSAHSYGKNLTTKENGLWSMQAKVWPGPVWASGSQVPLWAC
nr:MAG TPA: hypothetical protein [Caudoviricetes sp.]